LVSAQPVVNPTVAALNALQIYDPDQAAAYREHAKGVQAVLGADFPTRLAQWVGEWAEKGGPAALILTGNAGTGKTAAAEAFCASVGSELPLEAEEVELALNRFLVKDLSDFGSHSRLAYAEIHPDQKAATVAAFLERALAFTPATGSSRSG
jgi:hypothetical protein